MGQISNTFMGRGAGAPQRTATATTGCCAAQMRKTYSMLLAETLNLEDGARSSHSALCNICLAKAEQIRSIPHQHCVLESSLRSHGVLGLMSLMMCVSIPLLVLSCCFTMARLERNVIFCSYEFMLRSGGLLAATTLNFELSCIATSLRAAVAGASLPSVPLVAAVLFCICSLSGPGLLALDVP